MADKTAYHPCAFRRLAFSLDVIETTHLGAFDVYAKPVIRHWLGMKSHHSSGGGGGPGGSEESWWDIVFPNGTPKDLRWRWIPRPGFKAELTWDMDLFSREGGETGRLSVLVMHDVNMMHIKAPTGLGIFYDPALIKLKAGFWGAGGRFSAPVLQGHWGGVLATLRLGGGVFAYRSHTSMKVDSAFLRLRFRKTRYRLRPLLDVGLGLSHPSRTHVHRPDWRLSMGLEAFPTDHFWTFIARAGFTIRF